MSLAKRLTAKLDDRRLKLNVGGVVFETMRSTLSKRPATRLAHLAEQMEADDTWDRDKGEYFFDRHPGVFSSILHCYRTDELHTEHNLCGNIIKHVSTQEGGACGCEERKWRGAVGVGVAICTEAV